MKASPASSLPKGKGGFNFAYFSYLRWLVFLCFFFLLLEFLLPSELRKVFNLTFTYLSWAPRYLLRKALLGLSSLKMIKGVSSLFWPRHRSRARENLISSNLSVLLGPRHRLRAREDFIWSVPCAHARGETCWTRGRIVLSMSKHLGQKSRFGAHARGEAYYSSVVSSMGCLNTKAA